MSEKQTGCKPVTLYFDASSYEEKDVTYLGYCLKSYSNEWLGFGRARLDYYLPSVQAEYEALINGLSYIHMHYDVGAIHIRGDCQSVILASDPDTSVTPNQEDISEYVDRVRSLMEHAQTVTFGEIPREENSVAHELASNGKKDGEKVVDPVTHTVTITRPEQSK